LTKRLGSGSSPTRKDGSRYSSALSSPSAGPAAVTRQGDSREGKRRRGAGPVSPGDEADMKSSLSLLSSVSTVDRSLGSNVDDTKILAVGHSGHANEGDSAGHRDDVDAERRRSVTSHGEGSEQDTSADQPVKVEPPSDPPPVADTKSVGRESSRRRSKTREFPTSRNRVNHVGAYHPTSDAVHISAGKKTAVTTDMIVQELCTTGALRSVVLSMLSSRKDVRHFAWLIFNQANQAVQTAAARVGDCDGAISPQALTWSASLVEQVHSRRYHVCMLLSMSVSTPIKSQGW